MHLLDLADNPSWYEADLILAHCKSIPMSVYDIAVNVKGINESKMHMLHSVVVLPTVSELTDHLPINAVVNMFEHLRENRICFLSVHRHHIEFIIAMGQSEILRPCDAICRSEGTRWATHYGIGWTIHGCEELVTYECVPAVVNHVVVFEKDKAFESTSAVELLKKFYALEFTKKLHDPRVGLSQSAQHAADIQHFTVCYFGDHFEVVFLSKQDDMTLPKNCAMALMCLNHLRNCWKNIRRIYEK